MAQVPGFALSIAVALICVLIPHWPANEHSTVYPKINLTDVRRWIAEEATYHNVADETIEERLQQSGATLQEVVHDLVQRAESSRSLRILLIGYTDVGKATLVNRIIGEELVVHDSQSGVQLITEGSINGIDVMVINMAGIMDAEEDGIKEIKHEAAKGVDLVLFCMQITQVRFRRNDVEMIRKVREVIPVEMWNNTVFVLTYANQLRCEDESYEEHLMEKLSQWKHVLLDAVENHGKASQEVAQKIPVIPAAYKDPDLPYCDEWSSPGKCRDWFSKLWFVVLERVQLGKKIALLEVNRLPYKKMISLNTDEEGSK